MRRPDTWPCLWALVLLAMSCGALFAFLTPASAWADDAAKAAKLKEIKAWESEITNLRKEKTELTELLAFWQKRLAGPASGRSEARKHVAVTQEALRACNSSIDIRQKLVNEVRKQLSRDKAPKAPNATENPKKKPAETQADKDAIKIRCDIPRDDFSIPTNTHPTFDKIIKQKINRKWTYFPDKSPASYREYYVSRMPGHFGREIYHGPHITFHHKTGKRATFTNYVNGKEDGWARTYYSDGTVASAIHYKNGKKHGYVVYFWPGFIPGGRPIKRYTKCDEGRAVKFCAEFTELGRPRRFEILPTAAELRTIPPDKPVTQRKWCTREYDTKGKLLSIRWYLRIKDIGLTRFQQKYLMRIDPHRIGPGGKYDSGYYVFQRYNKDGNVIEKGYVNSAFGRECSVDIVGTAMGHMITCYHPDPKAYACGKWVTAHGTVTDHGPCK